jgi:hypothetical protein
VSISTFGQVIKRKNYFPIWTFHQDSINIHGLSVGFWTAEKKRYTNTNGIKLELIGIGILIPIIPSSPIANSDSSFVKLVTKPLSERINGLNLSSTGTVCHSCLTNGVAAGAVGQVNGQVNGFSTLLMMNFVQKQNGFVIAGFNEAYIINGIQVGLSNYGHKTKGIQMAVIGNGSKQMTGLQIGLFNRAEKLRGIQIGLWNVNQKRKWPFINWNFDRFCR